LAWPEPDKVRVLLSEDQIREKVSELGRQITSDYNGKPLVLLGILNGSAPFLCDLMRCIELPLEYSFISISSYGSGSKSSGVVRLHGDLRIDVTNKHLLVVEDIVDTGLTLERSYLVPNLLACGAESVKLCALLDKPSRRKAQVVPDYAGFTIGDEFVVGYGLDLGGQYRNLPYVGIWQECRK
jgi:hypoxanthine phosphoribosyltransferase